MAQLYDTERELNEGGILASGICRFVGVRAQSGSSSSRYAPRMQWFDAAADP